MDNLDNLKAIWHTTNTDSLPSSKEMQQFIKKFRSQKLRNKWMLIIVSVLLSGMVGTVLSIAHFKLFVTYLGGSLIIAGCILLAASNIRSLRRFYQLEDYNNHDFLAFIEQTHQNQIYYYKKTMVVFAWLCTVGWILYAYESVYKHPLWLYGMYSTILVYLAVMWFVVRPRSFKKDQEKLSATRQRMENLLNQLK